jgi:alpha-1,2-mannosyltransferase
VNGGRTAAEWSIALVIAAIALLLFLNGSLISTWSALHTDLSINLVAADALRDGADPYGDTVLFDRAIALGSPTLLVYTQLFTSYIQPPTSALSLLPLTELGWREATRTYLVLNHIFLLGAVGIVLATVRPTVKLPWLIAGIALVLMLYSQIYGSFALGQVDALLALLLAVAFWGYCRGNAPVAGAAIALGAAIKLIPALLLLYFLWRRDFKAFAWGIGVGVALFVLSLAYIGPDIYRTYLLEIVPALLKGSPHYANASFATIIARLNTPPTVGPLPEMIYLDEVSLSLGWRIFGAAVGLAALATVAAILGRRQPAASARDPGRVLPEFYLVVTVGLIISSVTWEFYVVWLMPAFAAVLLAPDRVLPAASGLRWFFAGTAIVAFVLLNYPGDEYLFGDNGWFYHPEWVPGMWVEDRVRLYDTHLDLVLFLRLPALLLTGVVFSGLVLWWRAQEAGVAARTLASPAADAHASESPLVQGEPPGG